MSREIHVHFLPALFEPDELRGSTAVVIDVLRASTTIIHALAAGAEAVLPCEAVDEARAAANRAGRSALLAGERQGVRIEGFDLDNSPLRFTPEAVGGKTVVFTTTNGTRALLRSRQAERILVAAFVNLSAAVERLGGDRRPLHLVCAGTRGEITAEDVLAAGYIVSALQQQEGKVDLDDEAQVARAFSLSARAEEGCPLKAVQNSRGGRNLRKLGYEADIQRAAQIDLFDIVPEFDPETGTIILRPPE